MIQRKFFLAILGLSLAVFAIFFIWIKLAVAPIAPVEAIEPRQVIDQLTVKEITKAQKAQAAATEIKPVSYFAPILTFHYIATTSETSSVAIGLHVGPAEFEKILKSLQENKYQTVFAGEMAAYLSRGKRPPADWVALTFDDGYRDFYTNALPLLEKYQDKATLFIITGATSQAYLTPEQIKEIAQSGLVEIGSHSVNHPMLARLLPENIFKELADSKAYLERLLHEDITLICYPYGNYDTEVEKIAQRAGYSFGFTYNHHPLEDSMDMFAIDRASVWPGMDVVGFLGNLAEHNKDSLIATSGADNLIK
jgi:peptidoglycan/xylan/chitin deacetylase (PgdA/CDA1 family)